MDAASRPAICFNSICLYNIRQDKQRAVSKAKMQDSFYAIFFTELHLHFHLQKTALFACTCTFLIVKFIPRNCFFIPKMST